jgi:hypothetical protein
MHPRNMVCFKVKVVYHLHKGDHKDNNNNDDDNDNNNNNNNNNNNKIWSLNDRDRRSDLNRKNKMRVTRDMMTMTTTTTMMMINPWDGVLVGKVIATWIA